MARRKSKSKRMSHHGRRRRKLTSEKNFVQAVRRLRKLKTNQQHQAINMANNTFIRQLCNVLKKMKHAKLSAKTKKSLKRHKKKLRNLLHTNIGMSKRRQMLSQSGGGFLKTILRSIPIVGTVLDVINTV